ncbi:hypothetical protein K432DRAFT_396735 [Lepidopterella palustris CBS 459.81]|uniref:Uncharacterized protein n=1 Tax=Lepidopterella palustris CBS 459.81 TaxID=1314670 RepID=A0A8E2E2A9_9PEZI|nr:hypothetical protein K432DRAFT_396735 [Lepidopterella palustris CBS 459.81]
MDPVYAAERASRKRLWDALVRLDEENRRKPSNRTREKIWQPLSIVQVEREGENNCSELLELCYRCVTLVILKLFLTNSSPDTHYRKWLCSFCGNNMKDHSWSSFDSKENGIIVPRWQPAHCTLHKLLDRMAQDFFPGRKVSLDTKRSHFNDQTRLIFHEFDELSTVMSTTWIDLQKQRPKSASFQAMNINQQLEALKGWLKICEKGSAEDREEIHAHCQKDKDLAIPAKRVLNLANAATGIRYIVETANHKDRYVALSHCWGDPKRYPLMSTHATLKDLKVLI